MTPERTLIEGAAQLEIELDPAARSKLLAYLTLLQRWNKVYNLTAVREPGRMVSHHLLDCLAILPHLWPGKWLDVGCGAGLPGMVLAIMRQEWEFTLLDSNSKKTGFVQQAIIELGLKNASVFCARTEKWRPKEKYDGIISRAFAETGEFVMQTRHLRAENGRWAAMKGAPEEALGQLPDGVVVEQIIPLRVPMLEGARSLIILKAA